MNHIQRSRNTPAFHSMKREQVSLIYKSPKKRNYDYCCFSSVYSFDTGYNKVLQIETKTRHFPMYKNV